MGITIPENYFCGSMPTYPIYLPQEALNEFCRKHGIHKLWLYGSVLTENFGAGSDVDVLAEFHSHIHPGWSMFALHEELEPILGRKVDFYTPEDFRPSRRAEILSKAALVYGE